MNGPTLIGPIAQAILKGLRTRVVGEIPELPEREPEVRVEPQTRDEYRTAWANLLVRHAYDSTHPPRRAREFFSGRSLLNLTLQDTVAREFPHVGGNEVRQACAAMYPEGGMLLLWSATLGTGKTTFALVCLLRHLRLEAERRADERALEVEKGASWRISAQTDAPPPRIVWASWRRSLGLIKAQLGRPYGEQLVANLRNADFLVLDDVGQMTPWEHGLLEDLIGARYEGIGRTVIVCSALRAQEDLQDVVGPRILSLLDERGVVVKVGGDGFRQPKKPSESVVVPL